MPRIFILAVVATLFTRPLTGLGSPPDVIDLMGDNLDAWQAKIGDWTHVGGVELDAKNPKKLVAKDGKGVWYNGPKGRTTNLYSKQKFDDIELHLEFNIPKEHLFINEMITPVCPIQQMQF